MNKLVSVVIVILTLLISGPAGAEAFMGINAKSRLEDVRSLFPNAKFVDLKPAWLQPHQRLIQIHGDGIPGTLAIQVENEVESTRILAKELAIRQANGQNEQWQSMVLEGLPERIARLQSNPPMDPWEVKDIRWEPPAPITLKTTITRYGPAGSDKIDEQFRRVVEWPNRGIVAYVNQSEQVDLFTFSFTMMDYACVGANANLSACKTRPVENNNRQKPAKR